MDGYTFVDSGDGSGYYVGSTGDVLTAADYQAMQQQQQQAQAEAAKQAQYGPSAWTVGYTQGTGQPQVINDYQGNPAIAVDANGNVVGWKGASGQNWTPATYNAAVASGQIPPPSNENPVDIVPIQDPTRAPFAQDLAKGMLFLAGGMLTAGLGTTSGLAEFLGSSLGATGSAATTVGNAILSAAQAGANGALSNQNPLIAALGAGINPFIGSGVSDLLQGAGLSADAAQIAAGATKGFTSGTLSGIAGGKSLSDALKSGELGALSSTLSTGFQVGAQDIAQALQDEQARQLMEEDIPPEGDLGNAQSYAKALSALEKQAQGYALDPQLAKLLGVSSTSTSALDALTAPSSTQRAEGGGGIGGTSLPKAATAGPSGGSGSSVTLYGPGYGGAAPSAGTASPGSQALSQALSVGSPSSATSDTSVPNPETGGAPQNVWNTASLRVKDATGSDY